jgi:hypothetical protein
MKSRISDRNWIAIIIFVLILEVLWLLTDLKWLHIPFLTKPASTSGQVEAGYVVKSKSDLKRRGGNSLVWEPAKEKDVLYYQDSVLTLAQSTAKLYLNDKTELDMAENTLVTLEQPEDKSQAEIRLRFSKGDLKARNPNTKAKIEGGEWVVNLEKGAEVSLRKDKDNYEFEVISGRASLQTDKGTENLQDSKILKLGENNQIEQIEKNNQLQWADSKAERLYTFEEQAEVPVKWAGPARQLQITQPGADDTRKEELKAGQQSAKIKLPAGSYKFRLSDESGLSSAKEIEVWKAPKIFPKKPLPRDRLSAGTQQEFVWSSEPGVAKYEIRINTKSGVITKETTDNFIRIPLEDENMDATWSVQGIDDEGNRIPALQENKIFIRRDPLAAPKLKTPELRELEEPPSAPGAFHWWHLLLNRAHAAQAGYEVNFEWEPVEGAEHYTIEISTDPEFKAPEVSMQTKAKNFKWQNFKPQKKYYWRVAAGSKKRMGVFTEATEVKPVKIVRPSKPELEAKAQAEAKAKEEAKAQAEAAEAEAKAAAEAAAKAAAEASAIAAKEKQEADQKAAAEAARFAAPNKPFIYGFALMPTYKLINVPVDATSKADLNGGGPTGFQFELQKNSYHFRINASSQLWKPSPESEFPLQQSLNIPEAWAFLNKGSWGIAIHQGFVAERETVGSIATSPQTHFGIRYALTNKLGLSGLLGGRSNEVGIDYEHKLYLTAPDSSLRFFVGGGVHFFYQVTKDGNGTNTSLNLLLGADTF